MTLRRATVAVLSAAVAVTTLAAPAHALEVDPQAPVVVDDSITLWPGESRSIDVLANDTDPGGDDLALCRLPAPPIAGPGPRPPVTVMDPSWFLGEGQPLLVQASPNARGTHTVDYYVCNHTRLTPAHLTVTIRPVAPVDVVTVPGKPGLVKVTNHNEHRILFMATDRTGCKRDGQAFVAPHATRVVEVRRHRISWTAYLVRGGVADHGRVRGIELDGPSAPEGPRGSSCAISVSFSH